MQTEAPSLSVISSLQVGHPRVELTLSELQDMAARQQQQIENQQQMLVAKVSFKNREWRSVQKVSSSTVTLGWGEYILG